MLTGAESQAVARSRCVTAAGRVHVTVNGRAVHLAARRESLTQARGKGGLPVLRLECALDAVDAVTPTWPLQLAVDVAPVTDNGWREITVSGSGTTVLTSDVPATSSSARLTAYPVDAVTAPLRVTSARATLAPGERASTGAGSGPARSAPGTAGPATLGGGPLTAALDSAVDRVFGTNGTSPWAATVLVLVSALVGTTHALAPGHGKTVMAAVALSSGGPSRRARLRDAFAVGATVTLAHTASVLLLAGVLWSLGSALPGLLLSGLEVVSGLLVMLVGTSLVRAAFRARRRRAAGPPETGHGHGHGHGHGPGHDEALDEPGRVGSVRLGVRRVLGLGVAGGLTPSPTALIILLVATAAGRAWLGALAVLAFGAGLAVTLVVVAVLAAVLGERWAATSSSAGRTAWWTTRWAGPARRVAHLAPVVPAAAVVVAGGGLALRGVGALLGV